VNRRHLSAVLHIRLSCCTHYAPRHGSHRAPQGEGAGSTPAHKRGNEHEQGRHVKPRPTHLLRHPRTQRITYLALLLVLMLANAAATWTVNNQTWGAGVLAVTNAINALLLAIGFKDLLQGSKS
jgi:hypothetical protein